MLLKINDAKDKTKFEDKVAFFKAVLIQEYINHLKVSQEIKNKIKKEVIKKLQIT